MTREERALKIAELVGWNFKKPLKNKLGHFDNNFKNEVNGFICKEPQLIELYSSFDGLMPIVERITQNEYSIDFTDFRFRITQRGKRYSFYSKAFDNLIDALQEAIIYYLENMKQENEKTN